LEDEIMELELGYDGTGDTEEIEKYD